MLHYVFALHVYVELTRLRLCQLYSRCLYEAPGAFGHRGPLQEVRFCRAGQEPQGE